MMMPIGKFLRDRIVSLRLDNDKNFSLDEINSRWHLLVDKNIFKNVFPIELAHGVLFVNVKSSAFKDQLKFHAEDIIDAVNSNVGDGEQVIREIRIAQPHQVAIFNEKRANAAAELQAQSSAKKSPPKSDETSLPSQEIARCEVAVQKIADDDLREVALQTVLSQAKCAKVKLTKGWHKCRTCDSLCADTETFCEVCRLNEREKVKRQLFKIFYDTPWLSSEDAQKIFLIEYPNLQELCSLEFVELTRISLIQLLAETLVNDESVDITCEAMRLILLERHLSPGEIIPSIIMHTLKDMKFNFSAPTRYLQHIKFKKFRSLKPK